MESKSLIVAGSEDGFPEHCCQNCGHDLRDYRHPESRWRTGWQNCDECPSCGKRPHWSIGKVESRKCSEAFQCAGCGEFFIQRVCYETMEEYVGDKTRTRVNRSATWPTCGACRERAQAQVHLRSFERATQRADEKQASQRRGLAMCRIECSRGVGDVFFPEAAGNGRSEAWVRWDKGGEVRLAALLVQLGVEKPKIAPRTTRAV